MCDLRKARETQEKLGNVLPVLLKKITTAVCFVFMQLNWC